MNDKYKRSGVKREALAEILHKEIEKRQNVTIQGHEDSTYRGLPDEIAASGLMTKYAATRQLHRIFNPTYRTRSGKIVRQKVIDLNVADKILCALDLNYVWHTGLSDALVVSKCSECGEPIDEPSENCRACRKRQNVRDFHAKSAAVSAGNGLSADLAPARRTGGGTTLKEAA